MTNYERIKNMTIEEIAEILSKASPTICVKLNGQYVLADKESVKQWLESEVQENDR